MKKNLLALALLTMTAGAAMAADGTITVFGEVVTQTCTVAAAGGTPFSIALTACPVGSSMSAHFLPGATINNTTGNLINQAAAPTAGNVEVALYNTTGVTKINLAAAKGAQTSPAFVVPAGGATSMAYQAKYFATGVATTGKVQSNVDYNLSYF